MNSFVSAVVLSLSPFALLVGIGFFLQYRISRMAAVEAVPIEGGESGPAALDGKSSPLPVLRAHKTIKVTSKA